MKSHVKTTKDPERDRPLNKRKKADKPWRLQSKVVNGHELSQFSWRKFEGPENVWAYDAWEKYMSVDHALRELNKITRSYYGAQRKPVKFHWRFAGRELRLINTQTQEIVELEFGEREIYAKKD